MTTIAFYHNHKEDIGHVVRLLRVIEAIRERRPDARIFVFQAGRPQPDFEKAPGVSWLRLPRPFYSRSHYGAPAALSPAVAELRGRVLAEALARIRPDAFVTNFFPFGRRECARELSAAFRALQPLGTELFACVPMPYFSHAAAEVGELLHYARFYRKILIHAPEDSLQDMAREIGVERRIDAERFLGVFAALRGKLCYTGYVRPARPGDAAAAPAPLGRKVLVHRGGGSTSPEIVAQALRARARLAAGVEMFVAAGPASTPAELRAFRALLRSEKAADVELVRYAPALVDRIRASDVCVGTAGGTAHEQLYYGRKSVVIPYKGPPGARRADQLCRARMLERLLGATLLDYDRLAAAGLARAISRQLASRRVPTVYGATNPEWFEGGPRAAEAILSHLKGR